MMAAIAVPSRMSWSADRTAGRKFNSDDDRPDRRTGRALCSCRARDGLEIREAGGSCIRDDSASNRAPMWRRLGPAGGDNGPVRPGTI